MSAPRPPSPKRTRRGAAAWCAGVALFAAVVLWPVSTTWLRAAALLLFAALLLGLLALCRRRRVARAVLLGLTAIALTFLVLPARRPPDAHRLASEIVAAMQRYEGVRYVWGGEGMLGIDCSGLMRRGVIDALLLRGVRTADPGLVRRALTLWWHDTTARTLGVGAGGLTEVVQDSPNLNVASHALLQPADLAVTNDGVHVLAYVGEGTWIEADPILGRVVEVATPAEGNVWFTRPVRILRWRLLDRHPDPLP